MAATVELEPSTWAYSQDPIWVRLLTDLIPLDYDYSLVFSRFQIRISSTGPTVSETLELTWPGGSITYLVSTSISESGTNWPTKGGGESLSDYADRIADFLHHTETVTDLFYITREAPISGDEVIRITRKVSEPFALTVTDGLSNVAVTQSSVPVAVVPDNLRSLVQVWTDTPDANLARMLSSLHSPYRFADAQTELDIAASFAHLTPHLPNEATINPTPAASTLSAYEATSCVQQYYLRYADKFGTPAVSGALVKTEASYFAVLGSRSRDAISTGVPLLLHNYVRHDGEQFRKLVSENQPDWVYYRTEEAITAWVHLVVYWSDGTSSVYEPWSTTGVAMPANSIYYFPAGYNQLKLNSLSPSGGTASDAYIVAYDWCLGPMDDAENYMAYVYYDVEFEINAWNMYLLLSNGLGGCETVWLRGKKEYQLEATGEVTEKPREYGNTVSAGTFEKYNARGRAAWTVNTGWFDDTAYTEHLQQLALGQAWLCDVENRRFLKVIVEPEKTVWNNDDRNLHALQFTIRAGWSNTNINT